MRVSKNAGLITAGICAGIVNGLFGAGGGMILIPLLTRLGKIEDHSLFPSSIAIILPICLVSLGVTASGNPLPWSTATPYLLGSVIGGVLAGMFGKHIPTSWLHRILGLLIIWGGIRYLC